MNLTGKVALVTGAGSGLGEAVTFALSQAGVTVVAADINEIEAKRVAAQVSLHGGRASPSKMDVTQPEEVEEVVQSALRQYGHIDYLINNAGIDYTLSINELTIEQWQRVLGVNLTGAFICSKTMFPIMQAQGGGHIINISSTAGKRGWPNATAYCASKFGLVGFTQALAAEGKPMGIKASLVVPGGMRTRFFDRLEEQPDPKNLNDPLNVANLILYILAQPAESNINEVIISSVNETSWP
jgi:NAD(P)-dependent dehydrogenase (short-subunit alcohol dehydrogenase family)